MINLDISGDPNDSMTEKRREIFEPLGMQIANQMESTNARKRILRAPTMSLSAKDPSGRLSCWVVWGDSQEKTGYLPSGIP